MKFGRLLCCWVLVLVFFGCKEKEVPTLHVNQDMLPYCWFPIGSYWIYEEEGTPGWMDSVYVTNTYVTIFPEEGEGFESEHYGGGLMLRGRLNGLGLVPRPLNIGQDEAYTEMYEGYSNSTGEVTDIVFFWNPENQQALPSFPQDVAASLMDSVLVNGEVYHYAIEIHRNGIGARQTSRTIWVRGIGVVHREMVDGTVWNLVRHQIK